MVEGSISTSELPLFVLNGLFDSFCGEATLEDDFRNYKYDDVD